MQQASEWGCSAIALFVHVIKDQQMSSCLFLVYLLSYLTSLFIQPASILVPIPETREQGQSGWRDMCVSYCSIFRPVLCLRAYYTCMIKWLTAVSQLLHLLQYLALCLVDILSTSPVVTWYFDVLIRCLKLHHFSDTHHHHHYQAMSQH